MSDNSKFQRNRIFVPNNPFAPTLCPELAAEIGLNESILLLQLAYWIAISGHERDGRIWTYQSTRDIQSCFPFWSPATINRIIHSLETMDLIIIGNYNGHKYDRTRWFALNLEGLRRLKSIRLVEEEAEPAVAPASEPNQNETRSNQIETRSTQFETRSNQFETTIPKTTTKTTTKTTSSLSAKPLKAASPNVAAQPQQENDYTAPSDYQSPPSDYQSLPSDYQSSPLVTGSHPNNTNINNTKTNYSDSESNDQNKSRDSAIYSDSVAMQQEQGRPPPQDKPDSPLCPSTPGERILFAKLRRAAQDVDPKRRGPQRFGTRQQKEIFVRAEARLGPNLTAAIDAGLARGIIALGPMVAWCAKWTPEGRANENSGAGKRDLRDSKAYEAWLK